MNEAAFVESRNPEWARLSWLTDRAESSATQLSDGELDEFVKLYRKASGDLAKVRTFSANEPLQLYLNDLVGRSYAVLYTYRRKPLGESLLLALASAAQVVRRRAIFLAVSATLFFGSGLFFYGLYSLRPDVRAALHSSQMDENTKHWQEGMPGERSSGEDLMAWSFYSANNPRVSIVAATVASSTFGVGTAYMLIENGRMIGDLATSMSDVGKLPFLLGSLLPHGVPELSGLVVSGAAGLLLGWALIAPGQRKRGDSLKEAGKDAIVLVLVAVVLMFLAAPIEGFFSFNQRVPMPFKVGLGVAEIIAWTVFWTGYGQPSPKALGPAPR